MAKNPEDKDNLEQLEESIEIIMEQVARLTEDMTDVKDRLKQLEDKVEKQDSEK